MRPRRALTSRGDLKQVRDRAVVEPGLVELLDDLVGWRAFVAMGEGAGVCRSPPGPAESEQPSAFRFAPGLLHFLHVGGTDAADDRHEMISDPGPRRSFLDVGGERLIG